MKNIKDIDLKALIEQETHNKFNRGNMISCPWHKDKTPSLSVKKYSDKERYCCYSCGKKGDAIQFLRDIKNMSYVESCKYLDLELNEEYKIKLSLLDKIENVIKNSNLKDDKGNTLKYICTYTFVDQYNKAIYYKSKFKDVNGKSTERYFSINEDTGQVEFKRNHIEVPYNYYKLLEGLKCGKRIFLTEGEKDCETICHMGYIAASFKGVTDFNYELFKDAIVYITPDTGIAGEKYKDALFYELKDYVKEFNVIYPNEWDNYPDNFDITDYFNSGKTLDDYKVAIKDKWDYIKNKDFKYVTKNGTPKKIWENFKRICELNKITIKYNELSKKLEFTGNIFNLINNDAACTEDLYSLCVKSNFNVSKRDLKDFIFRVSQDNSYNPAKNYFINCYESWNHKQGYIKKLAASIITPDDYDDNFKELLLRKWLIGTANISFNDGTQNMNGILVIQGRQGIGKTRWIKTLLPDLKWIDTDKYINPKKVDDIVDVTSALIVELGELCTSLKKETNDALKMFFTRTKDRYRRLYGVNSEEYPRVTSFYATVNNEEFLEDSTGNRRYWCIRVESMNVDHKIDINQLWGEVMHLLKDDKEPHWLSSEEEKQLYSVNEGFENKSGTEIKIFDSLNWSAPIENWIYKPLSQLCEELNIKMNVDTRTALKKLGAIPPKDNNPFRIKGYEGSKKWWRVPPINFTIKEDNSIDLEKEDNSYNQQRLI